MIKLLMKFWASIASIRAHVVTEFLLIPPFSARVLYFLESRLMGWLELLVLRRLRRLFGVLGMRRPQVLMGFLLVFSRRLGLPWVTRFAKQS